ncbi:MAG: GAF domain-containing protein [Chloroflexi bacterium]|nr:GAF domain-containing protein [Chloroflexota bacterium]MBP8058163.1 GAF domain-containing protein [Chloroflexota bacterium]
MLDTPVTTRFLQNETKRLQQENHELRDEVLLLRGILNALRQLHEVSTIIDAETDILLLLDGILEVALNTLGAMDGSLMLVDEEAQELVFVVVHGAIRHSLVGHHIPIGTGIAGWVAQHHEPVIVGNVYDDPRFSAGVDKRFAFRTQALLCVPIIYNQKVLGVFQALNKRNGESFTLADQSLLGVVAQLAATAMHKAQMSSEQEEGQGKEQG